MHILNSQKHSCFRTQKLSLAAAAIGSALLMSSSASLAQDDPSAEEDLEVIQVSGIAESYRNAISQKRNAATIVDALSSADIGALPDLSVAETLERITGVTGDRFKGNASEISIRGLGPFLGFSTVNGRAISSGSGNRSVAFTQFPSELVNGVVVYKSQKADLLEGGVSGLVDLQTIKPVDYGKERLQAELRGNYNPYQAKFSGEDGLGSKSSISYTNTYDLEDGGKFGFAMGYAGSFTSAPEESYNTSSTLRNCNSDYQGSGSSNCNFSDSNDAANGGAAAEGDFFYIPNAFYYRQMESKEDRDSAIFAMQWQPNNNLDINLDGQWSSRDYYEDRHDLLFDDGRRRISNWTTNDEHALQSYSGESRISSYGEFRRRDEDYRGLGLNIDWQATSHLNVKFDAAYSDTERFQTRTYARFRSDRHYYDWVNQGADNFADIANVYTNRTDPQGSSIDLHNEIQDFSFFGANREARNYRFDIKDTINSYRLDFEYAIDEGAFTAIDFGTSFVSHRHNNYQEVRASYAPGGDEGSEKFATVSSNCLIDWPQSDFGEDANSPVSSWATYDTKCAYDILAAGQDLSVDPKAPSDGDVVMQEDISAIYAMAEFSTEWSGMPVDGNFGVRLVETDIQSTGVRTSYNVTTDAEGIISFNENADVIELSELENSYTNLLPSVNVSIGLSDDMQLRLAAFQGISRPDMWYYGAGRRIDSDTGEATSVANALEGNVSALGNPFLEALKSDNFDIGLTYFLDADTMVSGALYYKTFGARFESASDLEDVIVDGQSYNVEVSGRPTIIDEDSSINGYELTALHRFTTLPEPFDGIGFSLNYNFANSDFQTPEATTLIADEVKDSITPANIAGLSKHNFSSQLYWEVDDWSARVSYKYRSEYLKPFGPSLSQNNRFVDDTQSVDFDISYKINKHFKARFQVINLTNEPNVEQRVAHGAYNRIEYSGPRFFFGVKYKM
jgi:TonB-dependent receptor